MVAAETEVAAKEVVIQAEEHQAAATMEVETWEAETMVVACMAAVRMVVAVAAAAGRQECQAGGK